MIRKRVYTPWFICLSLCFHFAITPKLEAGELQAEPTAHAGDGYAVTWVAPSTYIQGESFPVQISLRSTSKEPVSVPVWLMTSVAFDVNRLAVGVRDAKAGKLYLEPSGSYTAEFDLGPRLNELEGTRSSFRLGLGIEQPEAAREVHVLRAAERGIDFMTIAVEQLADYQVVLRTVRGDLRLSLLPDLAPNHVRSFLELSYTGFYDGNKFHRVVPGYMIQAGTARAGTKAPRTLNAELSLTRHEPGVLSMARLDGDVNSATSEFFIMHHADPRLDGKYSVFGKLEEGLPVLEQIVHSGDKRFRVSDVRAHRPPVDQTIHKAIVIKAPSKRESEGR